AWSLRAEPDFTAADFRGHLQIWLDNFPGDLSDFFRVLVDPWAAPLLRPNVPGGLGWTWKLGLVDRWVLLRRLLILDGCAHPSRVSGMLESGADVFDPMKDSASQHLLILTGRPPPAQIPPSAQK